MQRDKQVISNFVSEENKLLYVFTGEKSTPLVYVQYSIVITYVIDVSNVE